MLKQIPTSRLAITLFALLSLFIASTPRIPKAESAPGQTELSTEETIATTAEAKLASAYGNLPLSFEPNRGQADKQVSFLARGPRYTLFLSATEALLSLHNSAENSEGVRMKLVGANPATKLAGERELQGKSNYMIGSDRRKWQANIPTFASVRGERVYPGIDVVYYGTDQRRLEYDFVVSPGADFGRIRLMFEGPQELSVDTDGSLRLKLPSGEVVQPAPVIYQEINGQRHVVNGHYVLAGGNEVTFEIGDYDRTRTLVIDPQIVYASYHGGSATDKAEGIAVDASGQAYIVGSTDSVDMRMQSALQGPREPSDVFVVKINAAGTDVIYSTYIGGSSSDVGNAIAVTSDGKACITGLTSNDFIENDYPTTSSAYQQNGFFLSYRGKDSIVTVLNPGGNSLAYSSFFAGDEDDEGAGIAVDGNNKVYVTGTTGSRDFPTKNAFQDRNEGVVAYVAKFDPAERNNDSLVYSSYLGGQNGRQEATAIAVTAAGVAFVTGTTFATDFPTRSSSSLPPFQANYRGNLDAYLAKVSTSGSLIYSTYFGGNGEDLARAIAVDANERAYLTGYTFSSATTFPLKNAFDSTRNGLSDSFVAKFNADGTALFYSSFTTGGDVNNQAEAIAIDRLGNAYVAGFLFTRGLAFPIINGFPADVPRGNTFLVKIGASNATGTNVPEVLCSATFVGGSPKGMAIDRRGSLYLAGVIRGDEVPFSTQGGFQPNFGGGEFDAFVTKLAMGSTDTIGVWRPSTQQFLLRNSNSAGGPDITIRFGNAGDLPVAGDWDGNGISDVGVFRPSTRQFLLRLPAANNGEQVITINFGQAGDLPVAGDWNGDGIDTPGVFRADRTGTFLLTNSIANNSSPQPDHVFSFGRAGDLPLAGDWDADTIDTVGVFRPDVAGTMLLANEFINVADITFNFGEAGDLPFGGDWTATGQDIVGIFRPSLARMFLANEFENNADIIFFYEQSPDLPVAGDWDGK